MKRIYLIPIIGVLAFIYFAFASYSTKHASEDAFERGEKERAGTAAIHTVREQLSEIAAAISRFSSDVGRLPNTLKELTNKPTDGDHWRGPYIYDPFIVTDRWGQNIRYRYPGKRDPSHYDLYSPGPDRHDETGDDIVYVAP